MLIMITIVSVMKVVARILVMILIMRQLQLQEEMMMMMVVLVVVVGMFAGGCRLSFSKPVVLRANTPLPSSNALSAKPWTPGRDNKHTLGKDTAVSQIQTHRCARRTHTHTL